MLKKLLLPFLFVAFFVNMAFAQTGTITGTVTNEEGEPVPTANVLLVEISRGAATNLQGEYTIDNVEPGTYTLRVTFVGYTDYTDQVIIEAGETLTKNVVLKEGAIGLEALVVTGFGNESKVEYTGSASTVNVSSQIENVPTVNLGDALQGSVTGLSVVAATGTPGAPVDFNVRGVTSINAGSQPLFVVDGVPITTGSFQAGDATSNIGLLTSIPPQNIASVTVLKGPVATAQYGAQGANGVILITTKRGTAGQTQYSISYQVGTIGRAVDGPESLNAAQLVTLAVESFDHAGVPIDSAAIVDVYGWWDGETNTNWTNKVTNENATTQSFNLSASGGTESATFFGSLTYDNMESIIINSGYERFGGQFNFSYDFNESIDVTNQFTGSYANQEGILEGAGYFGNPVLARYFFPSTVPAYNDDGTPNLAIPVGFNPLYTTKNDISSTRTYRMINSTKLNIDITDNFAFHSEVGIDYLVNEEKLYRNPNYGDGADLGGTSEAIYTRVFNGSLQNGFNYIWDINSDNTLEARLIGTAQLYKYYRIYAFSSGFPGEGLTNLASAAVPRSASSTIEDGGLLSVLAKVHYSYKDKIFLDATIRREGNSRFAQDYRWGTFYGVGAGWLLSAEDFLSGNEIIDFLKVKASYGVSGNNAIGRNQYQALIGTGSYNSLATYSPIQFANPRLTWEKKRAYEAGLSFGLFNRIDGDVTYFRTKSYDLLYTLPLSETTGIGSTLTNIGELKGKGIEASIDIDVVRTGDFLLSVNGDFTYVTNEVTELPVGPTGNTLTIETGTKYYAVEGYAIGQWYMRTWAGVDPETGAPLWEVNDGDETPGETTSNYFAAQKEIQGGSGYPTHYGSVGIRVNYKGFYAGASLYGSFGNKVYDGWAFYLASDGQYGSTLAFGQYASQLERWQEPGDITDVPKRIYGGNSNSNETSSRFLYDGDYLRLQTVRLGYNVPVTLLDQLNIGVRGLNVFIVGRNLWTYTFDPELEYDPQTDRTGFLDLYAQAQKAFTFGINIQF